MIQPDKPKLWSEVKPPSNEDLLAALKTVAPKEADSIQKKIKEEAGKKQRATEQQEAQRASALEEAKTKELAAEIERRKAKITSLYPISQAFTREHLKTMPAEGGNKSYLALMVENRRMQVGESWEKGRRDIAVVLKEGVTNPKMMGWLIDEMVHGREVRLNVDWAFRFNEDFTAATPRVAELSVWTTTRKYKGLNPRDHTFDDYTVVTDKKVLYNETGNLKSSRDVKIETQRNPHYDIQPEEPGFMVDDSGA